MVSGSLSKAERLLFERDRIFPACGAALSGAVVAIGFVGKCRSHPLSAVAGSTEMVGSPSFRPTFLAQASSEDNWPEQQLFWHLGALNGAKAIPKDHRRLALEDCEKAISVSGRQKTETCASARGTNTQAKREEAAPPARILRRSAWPENAGFASRLHSLECSARQDGWPERLAQWLPVRPPCWRNRRTHARQHLPGQHKCANANQRERKQTDRKRESWPLDFDDFPRHSEAGMEGCARGICVTCSCRSPDFSQPDSLWRRPTSIPKSAHYGGSSITVGDAAARWSEFHHIRLEMPASSRCHAAVRPRIPRAAAT